MASGDQMFVSGDMSWIAGTSDINKVPPLECGGEFLMGGYSTRVVSTKPSAYSSTVELDATEIMLFKQVTEATNINGMYRDSTFVEGCGAPWSEEICGPTPEETAVYPAYCSGAQFSNFAIGKNMAVKSSSGVIQASTEFPDSMAAQAVMSGDGRGTITMRSINMAGIGNTSELGYVNNMKKEVTAGGKQFGVGATFQWESFANLWNVEEEPEPTPV
jgi:hypothetical protein